MNSEKIFFLNGHKLILLEILTIEQVIRYFNYKNAIFIVEYNNLVCNPMEWRRQTIDLNDKLEIITIVGGG